jgi:hypothetical protein
MKAISLPTLAVETAAYVKLQREMHEALLAQHPEWVDLNGACPMCDDYDRRFAQLLSLSAAFEPTTAR